MDMQGDSMSYSCSGAAWTDPQGDKAGTWTAHILTGVALLLWGLHWTFATFCGWLFQTRQRPYRSRTAYSLPILPSHWPIESVFKVLVPLAGIFFNLIDSHGWRSNVCPPGAAHAGHFNPDTVYSYANVWILVGFLLSGLVDLLGNLIELPPGTERFFLSLGFMMQAFILSEWNYGSMLAGNLYYLVFLLSAGAVFFILAEIVWPHSFFVSCGRIFCVNLMAIWYFCIARFLYENRLAWDSVHPLPDMAPAAFVPVPFVFWMNFTSLFMFLGYLLMRHIYRNQVDESIHDVTHALSSRPLPHAPKGGAHELVPLVSRH